MAAMTKSCLKCVVFEKNLNNEPNQKTDNHKITNDISLTTKPYCKILGKRNSQSSSLISNNLQKDTATSTAAMFFKIFVTGKRNQIPGLSPYSFQRDIFSILIFHSSIEIALQKGQSMEEEKTPKPKKYGEGTKIHLFLIRDQT